MAEVKEKRVQDLIPIRSIYDEMIETTDKRLVKILSVSAVNTHLMSYAEEQEVLEGYEAFLKNLDQPIQITRVAQPVDLRGYIYSLYQVYQKTENPFKKKMLKSYVQYAKDLQEDRDMIRRRRYVVIDEAFSDPQAKEKAIKKLRRRVSDLTLGLEEMLYRHKLVVNELSNDELTEYIHMMFDYENAQINDLGEDRTSPYIMGSKNRSRMDEAIRKRDDFLL